MCRCGGSWEHLSAESFSIQRETGRVHTRDEIDVALFDSTPNGCSLQAVRGSHVPARLIVLRGRRVLTTTSGRHLSTLSQDTGMRSCATPWKHTKQTPSYATRFLKHIHERRIQPKPNGTCFSCCHRDVRAHSDRTPLGREWRAKAKPNSTDTRHTLTPSKQCTPA